jgi:hypothetical protein
MLRQTPEEIRLPEVQEAIQQAKRQLARLSGS